MKRSNIDDLLKQQEHVDVITRNVIERIQLCKLNTLLEREALRGGFYRDLPRHLSSPEQLRELPFTTPEDLVIHGGQMLIRSQGEVEKVISEQTSGTTGAGKRVFYTEADCEHTIELFMAGLGEFIFPGSVTMIAMPFNGPMGLGELIAEAVRRLGARPLAVGVDKTYGDLQEIMRIEQPDTYVGMPAACLSMLRMCGKGSLRRALVSGDACPVSVTAAIEEILGSKLWPHYGSREMGLGGAICCPAHEGMHLRENHVIPEIIDADGNVLPDGTWGELVITTIGMEAQPLIRYRTGDYTRLLPGVCRCGSEVKRIDTVKRMDQKEGLLDLDEIMFRMPEVVDYAVRDEGEGLTLQVLFSAAQAEALPEELIEGSAVQRTQRSAERLTEVLAEQLAGYRITGIDARAAEPGDHILYAAKRKILRR